MGTSYRYSAFLLSPQPGARSADGETGKPEVFLAEATPHDCRTSSGAEQTLSAAMPVSNGKGF